MTSVTFDRTSLSLEPLVVGLWSPSASLWIDDLDEPGFAMRHHYAPDSRFAAGKQLLSTVLDAAVVPVTIYARGTSAANLRAVKDELAAAASQFSYTLTVDLGGDVQAFPADPTWPQWFNDEGMVAAFLASTSLSIPVNPPGA